MYKVGDLVKFSRDESIWKVEIIEEDPNTAYFGHQLSPVKVNDLERYYSHINNLYYFGNISNDNTFKIFKPKRRDHFPSWW